MEVVLIVSSSDLLSQLPGRVADTESPLRETPRCSVMSRLHLRVITKPAVLGVLGGLRPLAYFTGFRAILSSRTVQFPVPAQTFSTSLSGGEFYLPEISVHPLSCCCEQIPPTNAAQRGGGAHSLGEQPAVERRRGVAPSGSVVGGV